MTTPIRIFIAYSREDAPYLKEIKKALKPLELKGSAKIWYDGEIQPGTTWEDEIKQALHNADIIMLLVSSDAIDSEYFYKKEVKEALDRHEQGLCHVVPVILRDCLWEETQLAKLQALPKDAKPIADWKTPDAAYKSIAVGVAKLVDEIKADRNQADHDKNEQERLKAEREEAEQLRQENQKRLENEQYKRKQQTEQDQLNREREEAKNKKQFWQQLQAADELYAQQKYAQAQTAYQNLLNWDNKTDLGYTSAQPHLAQRLISCKTETQHATLKKQAYDLHQQGKYKNALAIVQQALQHRTDPEMGNLQTELNRLIEETNQQRNALLKKIGAGVSGLLLLCLLVWGIKGMMGRKNDAPTTPTSKADSTQIQTATEPVPIPIDTHKVVASISPATPSAEKLAALLKTANDLYTKGKYAEAKAKYTEALKDDPKNTDLKKRMKECETQMKVENLLDDAKDLYSLNKYAEAKAKYTEALKLQPDNAALQQRIKNCEEQLKPKPSATTPIGGGSKPSATTTTQATETPPPPKPTPTATTIGGGSKPSIKMVNIPGKNLQMSETEITIGQYLAFCKATNSHYPIWLEQGNEYNIHTGTNGAYKSIGMSESNTNYPITGVSATDADAFCQWMGGRLPTEQEWEYAAKGGQSYEYAGSNNIDEVAWYDDNSGSKAHPVKQKRANGYGLYDMSGNVWEWTSSTEGSYRVLRGGSWLFIAAYCRLAFRDDYAPAYRGFNVGFRVVFVP